MGAQRKGAPLGTRQWLDVVVGVRMDCGMRQICYVRHRVGREEASCGVRAAAGMHGEGPAIASSCSVVMWNGHGLGIPRERGSGGLSWQAADGAQMAGETAGPSLARVSLNGANAG